MPLGDTKQPRKGRKGSGTWSTWGMRKVTLRRVDRQTFDGVLEVMPRDDQRQLVASVELSLAEVDANDALTPFAIYDGSQLGLPEPDRAPIGFAVIEVVASVGFVLRLLIDADSQGRGLGRAALSELVRRLRLNPDVELIATSYREDNLVMAGLCADLGFVAWRTPFPPPPGEVFVCLPD